MSHLISGMGGIELYARRAECDQDGNVIKTAYQNKAGYGYVDTVDTVPYGGFMVQQLDGGTHGVMTNDSPFLEPCSVHVDTVEYNRNFTTNVMSTMWFPFSTEKSNIPGCRIFELAEVVYDENNKAVTRLVELDDSVDVLSGKPYIVIAENAGQLAFNTPEGVDIDTSTMRPYEVGGVLGDGVFIPVAKDIAAFGELDDWSANKFYGVAGGTFVKCGATAYIKMYRCYYKVPNSASTETV